MADYRKASAPVRLGWVDLGIQPYDKAWKLQEDVRRDVLNRKHDGILLFTEHPPTFTLGRGEKGMNLMTDSSVLRDAGYHVTETSRGGKVTFHGPGQLVAYPVLNLRTIKRGVKDFICAMEKSMIRAMGRIGISAHRRDGYPGAWVGDRKIGSIGIHVRKHVSIHGLALNVCTDLKHFAWITPCGIDGVRMTSIENEGVELSPSQFRFLFLQEFSKELNCEFDELGREDPSIHSGALSEITPSDFVHV